MSVTRTLGLLALALVATGCKRQFPESELGDLSLAVFRDFDADPAALPETVDHMDRLLADLNLGGKQGKRTFELPPLDPEYRSDVTVPKNLDPAGFRLGVAGRSSHSVDDNMVAQTQGDQVCINADAVKCHRRLALTDADCFLAHDCEDFRTYNTIRLETLLVDIWFDAPVDFRWVALPDGREAVVSRTWLEEEFTSDKGKTTWNQRFGVDVFIPDPKDPDGTRRWYATWMSGETPGAAHNWVRQALISGLDEGFENPDHWLDDGECKVDTSECVFPN